MKGFGTFDTTNTLYGSFYSRQQDPIKNIPKYTIPDPNMEQQFYKRTLEMQKGYFNRYAHLYKDPTNLFIIQLILKLSKKKMLKDHYLRPNHNLFKSNNNLKKIFQSKDLMCFPMKWQKIKPQMNR